MSPANRYDSSLPDGVAGGGTGGPRSREITAYDRALTDALDTLDEDDEQWGGSLHLTVATRLAGLAQPRPGDACLDVGGGAGVVAAALSSAVGSAGWVVSLDLSARSIEVARGRATANTHLMRMSGDEVIFRDHTFDVVVLSRSVAYEKDAGAVIAEAGRTLKVGGRLALFCRRRGLATVAEQAFLEELEHFARDYGINLPDRFLAYPGWADRHQVGIVLRSLGFDEVTFGDVVTGGRAADAAAWNREMMGCWPAARIVVGALAGRTRAEFDARVERVMSALDDDAYRYHHPYLLAAAVKARDVAVTAIESETGAPAHPMIQQR